MKKRLMCLLSVLLIAVTLVPMASAAAKPPTISAKKYIQAYLLNTTGNATLYKDEALKTKLGTISRATYAKTEFYIVGYSSKYKSVQVSVPYPKPSSNRVTCWISSTEFSKYDFRNKYDYKVFYKQVTTYTRADGKTKYGYVSNGDKVCVLGPGGAKNAYTQLIYPISGGKYKLGWVKTTEYTAAIKVPISKCTITVASPVKWTGKAVKTTVVVKFGNITLKEGKDYTLKYTNNVNPGTGKVTVTGKGNYTGSVTKSFLIKVQYAKKPEYGKYTGIDYTTLTKDKHRIAALNKAKNMVTVKWVAPVTFHTWRGSNGSYNKVKATDGTSSTYFVAGKTYMGVPYSMKERTYDDIKWWNWLRGDPPKDDFEAYYYKSGKGTAKGIDCSYFVCTALNAAGTSRKFDSAHSTTSTMVSSGHLTRISYAKLQPGDILLKAGSHVMMYVGKPATGRLAVFEADAGDSKCSYNVYKGSTLADSGYIAYTFKGYSEK